MEKTKEKPLSLSARKPRERESLQGKEDELRKIVVSILVDYNLNSTRTETTKQTADNIINIIKEEVKKEFLKDNNFVPKRDVELLVMKAHSDERRKCEQEFIEFLITIENQLDILNGNSGKYCLYCSATKYNGNGIIHHDDCPILRIRNKIKELKK